MECSICKTIEGPEGPAEGLQGISLWFRCSLCIQPVHTTCLNRWACYQATGHVQHNEEIPLQRCPLCRGLNGFNPHLGVLPTLDEDDDFEDYDFNMYSSSIDDGDRENRLRPRRLLTVLLLVLVLLLLILVLNDLFLNYSLY